MFIGFSQQALGSGFRQHDFSERREELANGCNIRGSTIGELTVVTELPKMAVFSGERPNDLNDFDDLITDLWSLRSLKS
jgi:hypothetical protein